MFDFFILHQYCEKKNMEENYSRNLSSWKDISTLTQNNIHNIFPEKSNVPRIKE